MRILLAVDDSKFSEAAIQAVAAQVRPQDAEVRVLHIVEPILAGEMGASLPDIEIAQGAQRSHGQSLVARVANELRAKAFKVSTAVEEGRAKTGIIDHAAKWGADLIVLGSHGRKGLDRFLMGSVSEAVARHAPCSVEVVRLAA